MCTVLLDMHTYFPAFNGTHLIWYLMSASKLSKIFSFTLAGKSILKTILAHRVLADAALCFPVPLIDTVATRKEHIWTITLLLKVIFNF